MFRPSSGRALLGLFSSTPRSVHDMHDPALSAKLRELAASGKFERIIAFSWEMAAYADDFEGVPAILEELQIGMMTSPLEEAETLKQRLRTSLTIWKLKRYTPQLVHKFRVVTVPSTQEYQLLAKFAPKYEQKMIIPNCMALTDFATVTAQEGMEKVLLYAGAITYDANYEAVAWFLREIFPLIRKKEPSAVLWVTGKHGERPLPTQDGVKLTGFVDDIHALVAGAAVSIVPIRTGGGTRLKILEAMGLRSAVVSTPKGAEGLGATDGTHLLLGETPQQFAEQVIRLLANDKLRERIEAAAYNFVAENYDWASVMPRYLQLVESLEA